MGSVLYGLGEEPGWRGWLLPYFQRRRGAVSSTLLLAVIWAGWHAPFFAYRFELGGTAMIVGFFIGLLAGAFWLTFVFNSTGGSVWVVAIRHVLWNVSNFLAAAVSDTLLGVLNALMMVLGFGVAAVWGRRSLTAGAGSAISGVQRGFRVDRQGPPQQHSVRFVHVEHVTAAQASPTGRAVEPACSPTSPLLDERNPPMSCFPRG